MDYSAAARRINSIVSDHLADAFDEIDRDIDVLMTRDQARQAIARGWGDGVELAWDEYFEDAE